VVPPPQTAPVTAEQKPPATTPANPPAVDPLNTAARSSDAPAIAPTGNAAVRIELTADEAVWVLVRADGKYVFSGTIEANQTRSLEANGVLMLRVGNAGGVSITQNGKAIGPIGPRGRCARFSSLPAVSRLSRRLNPFYLRPNSADGARPSAFSVPFPTARDAAAV